MRIDLDYNINNMETRVDNKYKAFTSLEQSKKLAEILQLESADMYYFLDPTPAGNIYHLVVQRVDVGTKNIPQYDEGDIPCWSLSALLDILPNSTDVSKADADTENERYMCTVGIKDDIISTFADNPVDVCVEMILKLHWQNLL